MMTIADISQLVKCDCISITAQGTVMIDVDGTGPTHNDPKANTKHQTSWKVVGHYPNADKVPYAVAPSLFSWDDGNGISIFKGRVVADISANGKTISNVPVADFGPNLPAGSDNTLFGEMSYAAVEALGIKPEETKNGPQVPGGNGIPVTITYYPQCPSSPKLRFHVSLRP